MLGAAAALGAAGLAGCRTNREEDPPNSQPSGGGSQADVTPTYQGFEGVTPDLPGDADLGIPNGYFAFPEDPPKVTDYPLAQTDPINILTQGIVANTALGDSSWYKMLQADLGNELPLNITLSSEYTQKFQTLIAGGELPELLMMTGAPELPKLLESRFTDLSEFLGGDEILKYPGLASIPTTAWSVSTLNGKLWGIPQARPPAGSIMSTRGDLLTPKGIDKDQAPADGAELLDLMKELTDRDAGVFAMGALPSSWLMNIILEMVGAPNGWLEEGGKFTQTYETEQYKEAIVHTKEFWDAGVLHPNSFTEPGSNSTWWQGGVTQVYIQGFTNWLYFTQRQPEFDLGMIKIPKWDGGGPAEKHQSDPAYGAYAAISKQDSPERVHEILSIMDYLAAPYGTDEYLRCNYGVEGEHWNMEDGVPTATDKVVDDPRRLVYFGSQVLADLTGPKSLVEAQSEYLHEVMPTSKSNPTTGLYSDTQASKGAAYVRNIGDTVGEIILGRKEMADFENLVKQWQDGIGKDIRAEYEEAFQQG